MSTQPSYTHAKFAKADHWFSRRHQTRDARDTTREIVRARRAAKYPTGAGRRDPIWRAI